MILNIWLYQIRSKLEIHLGKYITFPKLKLIITTLIYFKSPDVEGFIETSFEQTPLMSTYLVAFIVSDFEKTESDSTFNIYSQVSLLVLTDVDNTLLEFVCTLLHFAGLLLWFAGLFLCFAGHFL